MKTKIAISVSNEREFKALAKHYDELGWKSFGGGIDLSQIQVFTIPKTTPITVLYDNPFDFTTDATQFKRSYKNLTIIPFPVFAELKGLKIEKEPVVLQLTSVVKATISYNESAWVNEKERIDVNFSNNIDFLTEDEICKIAKAIEEFKAQ